MLKVRQPMPILIPYAHGHIRFVSKMSIPVSAHELGLIPRLCILMGLVSSVSVLITEVIVTRSIFFILTTLALEIGVRG